MAKAPWPYIKMLCDTMRAQLRPPRCWISVENLSRDTPEFRIRYQSVMWNRSRTLRYCRTYDLYATLLNISNIQVYIF